MANLTKTQRIYSSLMKAEVAVIAAKTGIDLNNEVSNFIKEGIKFSFFLGWNCIRPHLIEEPEDYANLQGYCRDVSHALEEWGVSQASPQGQAWLAISNAQPNIYRLAEELAEEVSRKIIANATAWEKQKQAARLTQAKTPFYLAELLNKKELALLLLS